MPAARAAAPRSIPSRALARASSRAPTRPSRSRRARTRNSAGVRSFVIGTATMTSTPARHPCPANWQAVAPGQDFLRPVLEVVSRFLVGRQPFGIRQAWRPFPVPLARGGEHGVEGDGVGGRDHRPDRGATVRHRTPPVPTIKVVEALRFFLREGVQWRELRAIVGRASGSTLRRRLDDWSAVALLRRVHAVLVRMVRAGPEAAPWDVVVDSCSVRAKHGGELTGPNPTDRGKPGTKYHVVVATDGIPLGAVPSAANVHDTRPFRICCT